MNVSPNYAEVAGRFGLVARRFCTLVDDAPSLDGIELLTELYRIFPQLIGEAIGLPNIELSDDITEEEDQRVSLARKKAEFNHAQWSQLYQFLMEKLGDSDPYCVVFDPIKESEAIYGSLANDIADIYRDLKDGIILGDSHQVPPEDNIWHWRARFYGHWGRHAINALRATHFRLEDILCGLTSRYSL
jgi:hypothetical protein